MSTIQSILSDLKTSSHPVAKALHKGDHFRILMLGFHKGMLLNDHKAHIPSKLTVVNGSVIYKEGDKIVTLQQYDEVEIPVEIIHSVEAIEDSLCILSQG
jgi:quercetin dioxygenase-like cupin family protein